MAEARSVRPSPARRSWFCPPGVSASIDGVISLDPVSSVPPYEQVRSQLARKITDRELAVGTRLPTVRALAAELGIAVNTVARAYRELEEAGLIETRGRAGTVVSAAGERSRERVLRAARAYASTAREQGLTADEALEIVRAALAD
ncbi:GntR family transcriptional regulator [Saccharothrix australiensis]|uniref:GntR family transcriptional regulator n=1 Tax=Saccharothrix australiensis TaxID=2072 RepID=A0A495W2N3_9PSEU|nr:GntR family transcriptional regulator [Saccharothrix australiensis]